MNSQRSSHALEDLRRLPEVWEPATSEIALAFSEIPAAVGVPGVHLIWRLLANFPSFLISAWPFLAANLRSASLAAGAEDLRRASFIVEAVGLPSHKAFRGDLIRAEIDADFRAKIENFNDGSQRSLSRLLLIAAALREAAASRGRSAAGPGTAGVPPVPGVPVAPASAAASPDASVSVPPPTPVYVPPLREAEAAGKARELLARIEREHGLPFLDDYYRSLGRIVDYLSAAWNAIRPLVGEVEYLARAAELSAMAVRLSAALPVAVPGESLLRGLDAGQAGQLSAVLGCLVEEILPQTLIDVTLIKALTSGPDHATT